MTEIKNNMQISFWQLLCSAKKIEIPIIQRDYAQGRNNVKTNKIRNQFLNSLIEAIEKSDEQLELDFVYGNIEKDVFQPLDGQQRLTTLYLLHWYLALRTNNLLETKNQFLKFTYETRISSREFCNAFIESGGTLGEGKTISEQIADSAWFFLSWKKDPTIKSMLKMLDSIEEKLKEKEKPLLNFWSKLTSNNPPITFLFKELDDIGLTDDLYIKMNARGKQLTDFENFKALFEKYIAGENQEGKDWEEDIKDKPEETFSHKIDTVWTDLFWKHRGEDNLVDNEIVKFVAGIGINYYAQNLEISKNEEEDILLRKKLEKKSKDKITDDGVKRERIEGRIRSLFNDPSNISPEDFSTKLAFEYLKTYFDVYSKDRNDLVKPSSLSLWDYCESKIVLINSFDKIENNLFVEFINNGETTYKQRALFYAQTQYLIKVENIDQESFSDWLRVVRNIVQNATIDSASAFIGAIGLIKEISAGCTGIYDYLSKNDIISGFASKQVKEEVLKSMQILNSITNKEAIFATEDTNFCKGKIMFALYCIGYENIEDHFNTHNLFAIQKLMETHLSGSDVSNNFRRGLFTIGDNYFYYYWSSWLYAVDAPKHCLIENILELKDFAYYPDYRFYLKELLVQLINVKLSVLLDSYDVPDTMPNWKKRIIKEEGLLDFSERHYMAIDEESCCWLIPRSKVANSKEGAKKCKRIK